MSIMKNLKNKSLGLYSVGEDYRVVKRCVSPDERLVTMFEQKSTGKFLTLQRTLEGKLLDGNNNPVQKRNYNHVTKRTAQKHFKSLVG